MFNIFTGELMRVFADHDKAIFHVAISPRGKYIASSSDKDIKIWNFKTGGLLTTFKGHEDDVTSLIFAPDYDNYLVSGSGSWELNECAIKIWDLDDRKLLGTESSHWAEISSLAFSRDGDILVSGAFDKTINVWDIENGKLIKTLIGSKSAVIDVAITNNKKKIISATLNSIIIVWDLNSGSKIREIIIDEEDFNLESIVLTPDSRFIVGGLQAECLKDGGLLKIWRLSDGELIQTLPIRQNFSGYYEELTNIAISNNGRFILSASQERMVKVWMLFRNYIEDF